jgi:hypothetical protein
VHHAKWFIGAVENFRFFDLKVYILTDAEGSVLREYFDQVRAAKALNTPIVGL